MVPVETIPELNKLPETILSSRHAHSVNLLGNLTGINVVEESSLHFRAILLKLTPALKKLTKPLKLRMGHEIEAAFPTEDSRWTVMEPLGHIVQWASSAFSMVSAPYPLCDDPEYIRLLFEQASLGRS